MSKAQTEQSTDLEKAATVAAGMAAIEPTAELVAMAYDAIQNGTLPPEVGDPKITAQLILQRIREGTLEESLNPAVSLPNLQNYRDKPMVFVGFHFNQIGRASCRERV